MIKVCNEKKIIMIICMIFCVLLIESLHVISIPQSILLLITFIIPFFLEKEEIIAYVVCFSMLGTRIQVAYICTSCVLNLIAKNKFKIDFGTLLTIGLFVLSELFNVLKFQEGTMTEILRYASVYLLVIYSLSMNLSEEGKKIIADTFILSTTFSVVLVITETLALTGWNFNIFFSGAIRLGYSEQLGGKLLFSADPNLLGQGCSLVISLCLIIIMSRKLEMKYIISMIICLFAGAMTISKTFLLSLLLLAILALFLCGEPKNPLKSFFRRCGLLILVCLLVFSVYKIYPAYLDNIMNRVDSSDITTGRSVIAAKYLNVISSNVKTLLFGIGIQNVGQKTGIIASPHSAIVEIFVCWGIIGVIYICSYIIYFIVKHSKSNNNLKKMNYIPLLVFLFITQTTQLFRVRDHILCLIVIIISCGFNLSWRGSNE